MFLQFVSKRHPEDVKEVVVWKRFSELKKLHGELAYTHRNLFRRMEEFPPFPRAQVFGTFGAFGNRETWTAPGGEGWERRAARSDMTSCVFCAGSAEDLLVLVTVPLLSVD